MTAITTHQPTTPTWGEVGDNMAKIADSKYSLAGDDQKEKMPLFNAMGKVIMFFNRSLPTEYALTLAPPEEFIDPLHQGLISRPVSHLCDTQEHSLDFANLKNLGSNTWECPYTRRHIAFAEFSPNYALQEEIYAFTSMSLEKLKEEAPDFQTSVVLKPYLDQDMEPIVVLSTRATRALSYPLHCPPNDQWIFDLYRTLSADSATPVSPRRQTVNF